MSETTVKWQATFRRRIGVAAAVAGLWVFGIQARLIYLQVYAHAKMLSEAEGQQQSVRILPGERGAITDRNGRALATSANVPTIIAVPKEIENPAEVIDRLCAALTKCTPKERATWLDRFNSKTKFAYIRRHVSDEEAARVDELNLPGIAVRQETKRFYPKGRLAAHLLGFAGLDDTDRVNKGLAGLEAAYDDQIRGRDGREYLVVDNKRRPFTSVQQPPTAGATMTLTIDERLQHIVERELEAGVNENRALGGTVIIMSPQTGELLSMASFPSFDPNDFASADDVHRRNRAVQDMYEPGSTFKIVTASAALEERVVQPGEVINVSPGYIRIGSRVIDDEHAYGELSFSDVIVKSSNVGAIKVGLRLGALTLGDYVRQFGFGRAISRDFPGESNGRVYRPDTWTESTLASVSMGYEIAVTPLQMVSAVSSIANGGQLMRPRIIKSVKGAGLDVDVRPEVIQRTVSPETAAAVTAMMEGVVINGTAKAAQIPGYSIAGKTGTAEKVIDGRYSNTYNASFVGFFPSRNPVAAMIVVIDTPRAKGYYGGVVAAPIFKRIAEQTLQYLGIPPTINAEPPVFVERNVQPVIRTVATPVVADMPRIVRVSAEVPGGAMPDLRGLSARDAMRTVTAMRLEPDMHGNGHVISQTPLPGEPLPVGKVILTLGRLSESVGSSGTGQP